MNEPNSEESLMEAYVDGDKAAFAKLFKRLAPRVHGFFLRKFGDPVIADDMLQITFMKIHRARDQYQKGSPLRPWLFTIAARVRLDELRRSNRRPETPDAEQIERVAEKERLAGDALIEQRDVAAKVRASVEALPESQRVVVQLHRFEGFTFQEIAKVLGSTEGAVKLRAFRAYGQLRKRLAHLLDEAPTVGSDKTTTQHLAAGDSAARDDATDDTAGIRK